MLPALWTRAPVQLQQEHEAFACHMGTWWEVREREKLGMRLRCLLQNFPLHPFTCCVARWKM